MSSDKNQCTICKKVGHEPRNCHFRCPPCATSGVFHSKTSCPKSTCSAQKVAAATTFCATKSTCSQNTCSAQKVTAATCSICSKPNHAEDKCHFRCTSCAKNNVFHSKTADCP